MIVKFPMTDHVWNAVVVDAAESVDVLREDSDFFFVEYASEDDFYNAIVRVDGMVEYFHIADEDVHF